jgi:hypothetical protein
MLSSARKTRHFISTLFMEFAAALLALILAPWIASAQQTTGHAATAPPRRPGVIAGGMYRAPAPASASPGVVVSPPIRSIAQSRPGGAAYPVRFAGVVQTPRLIDPRVPVAATFRAPVFLAPFFLGPAFPGELGLAGSVSQLGGMPLGFGLWPACDSAKTPGVFWTVGPCFGLGSYAPELAPSAAPPLSVAPLVLFSPPPSGPAVTPPPSAPGPPPPMMLYMSDGRTIAATDWWVAKGRLQYITESGETDAVDVLKLDLEKTIKENQKRGLDFRLKFTAPSDLYPPSIRP